MAKKKMSIAMKNAELVFDEKIKVIEHGKDSDVEYDLESILRQFEGVENLSISISTDKDI